MFLFSCCIYLLYLFKGKLVYNRLMGIFIRVQVQLVEDLERQMYKSGGKKRVEQEEGQLEWQIRQAE